jgi:hypothetical protein
MLYPDHLLPKMDYRLIEWRKELCEYYVLRAAPSADLIDPDTGMVRARFVNDNSREHLLDYSTNLIGIFSPKDVAIEWERNDRKHYYTSTWAIAEIVEPPSSSDFSIREDFGYFFYAIGTLHQYPQPINVARVPHTQAKCYVCHTPVRANFWHFSVRWKIGSEDVETTLTKNERRDLLGLVRTFLIEHAILELPTDKIIEIPETWYKSMPVNF